MRTAGRMGGGNAEVRALGRTGSGNAEMRTVGRTGGGNAERDRSGVRMMASRTDGGTVGRGRMMLLFGRVVVEEVAWRGKSSLHAAELYPHMCACAKER